MSTLLTILGFGFGFLAVLAVNILLVDIFDARRQQFRERLEEELRNEQRGRARGSLEQKELYELAAAGSIDLSTHMTLRERLGLFVDQSGARVTPQRVVFLVLLGTTAVAVAVAAVLGPVFGILLAPLGGAVPAGYLAFRRARRIKKLQAQLPDVFDLMGRMLRAGRTISQAFQTVADEFSRPASEEFGYAFEQQNLGLSAEATMRDLARRTGLLELKIFVIAVTIHQQTGGNLADLLEKLATIIRERFRILGMIRALTAEGRMQAIILLMLPPFLLGAIMVVNRPYGLILFQYPALLAGTAFFMILGAAWMHRIVNFDF